MAARIKSVAPTAIAGEATAGIDRELACGDRKDKAVTRVTPAALRRDRQYAIDQALYFNMWFVVLRSDALAHSAGKSC